MEKQMKSNVQIIETLQKNLDKLGEEVRFIGIMANEGGVSAVTICNVSAAEGFVLIDNLEKKVNDHILNSLKEVLE